MEVKSVILQTENIEEMRKFYVDCFGFPLIKEDEYSFRIAVGTSELEFTSENVKDNPYYHFAVNIPANKFDEAKSWVEERVSLNVEDGEDEVDFSRLPAHALEGGGEFVSFIF